MLGKLIKHEFRATGRVMLPMLGALLALALLANVSFMLLDHVGNAFLSMLLGLLIAAYFIGVFAAGVIAIVIMVDRFYKNLLGDQGYLMMTLPTNVHALIWSKLIVSLVWFLATGLVIMLTLIITGINITNMDITAGFEQLPTLAQILERICQETGTTVAGLIGLGLEFVLIVVMGALATCLHFYAAMSIGHTFSTRKVLLSVVFFVVINIAIQIFSSGAALLAGVSMDHFVTEMGFEFFAYALHFILALVTVESAAMYFTTALTLEKGLNLA